MENADQLTDFAPEPEYAVVPLAILAKGDRRLEGEAYLTGGYAIRRRIEALPRTEWSRVEALASVWQPGRLKGVGIEREHGIPFLTATQVFDILPTARKWLARSRTADLADRTVEAGWILVTRSGKVGDSIITYTPHLGHVISDDLLRVQVKDEALFGYLAIFLKTSHCRSMLQASQYGSIIKHLETDHLNELPILRAKTTEYKWYSTIAAEITQTREEAFRLLREAEALFASELGAPAPPPGEEGFAVPAVRLFGGTRRLDAYSHNPHAEAAEHRLARSGHNLELLRDLANIVGVPRFKHIYMETGIPYLDSEDLFKINPEITKHIPVKTRMRNVRSYYAEAGWLLMACSGQLYGLNGSVVLATKWHEKKIVSNHVLRIIPKPKKVRAGYLQMALGHAEVGRPLVLRCAFGTEVPEIDPGELSSFPVIRLGAAKEAAIADRVERASLLRMEADQKEREAVARLEKRIESRLGAGSEPVFDQMREGAPKVQDKNMIQPKT